MKRLLLLLLVIFITFNMVACVVTEKKDQTTEPIEADAPNVMEKPAEEKVTMKFWRIGTGNPDHDYWIEANSIFMDNNPNVEIEFTEVPAGAGVDAKLNAGFASGTAPDVLCFPINQVAQRVELGQYYPIDEYLDNWEVTPDIIEGNAVLDVAFYKGRRYGLPIKPDVKIFVYRKDYFEEAGLDPDTPPSSWEELKEYARKLTIKDNETVLRAGFDIPTQNSDQYFYAFLWQNGNDIVNLNDQSLLINEPSAIETLEYLASYKKENLIIPYDNLNFSEAPFVFGKAAMSIMSPITLHQMIKDNPELEGKLGVALSIKKERYAIFCGSHMMNITAQSQIKDIAWDFIEFLYTKDEIWKRYEQLGIPVVRKSLKDDYIDAHPFNKVIYDSIEVGEGMPLVTWSVLLKNHMNIAFEEAIFGKKSAEEALNDAYEAIMKEIGQ